jgi:uncharacterized protein YbaR (Trm112 family)
VVGAGICSTWEGYAGDLFDKIALMDRKVSSLPAMRRLVRPIVNLASKQAHLIRGEVPCDKQTSVYPISGDIPYLHMVSCSQIIG